MRCCGNAPVPSPFGPRPSSTSVRPLLYPALFLHPSSTPLAYGWARTQAERLQLEMVKLERECTELEETKAALAAQHGYVSALACTVHAYKRPC